MLLYCREYDNNINYNWYVRHHRQQPVASAFSRPDEDETQNTHEETA